MIAEKRIHIEQVKKILENPVYVDYVVNRINIYLYIKLDFN